MKLMKRITTISKLKIQKIELEFISHLMFFKLKNSFIIALVFIQTLSFAQNNDSIRFELQYNKIAHSIKEIHDSLEWSIGRMRGINELTDIQKAKMGFLRKGINNIYELDPLYYSATTNSPKSNENTLFSQAQIYIKQSKRNKGIPLLLKYLKTVDPSSDSAVFAKILLAEGYRKIVDYQKGINIIYKLFEEANLSLENKAFACNRIAAIYNECGNSIAKNRADSVIKYSEICIKISEENNFIEHLATSQNELTYIYKLKKEFQKSIDYGTQAVKNFISLGENTRAMQASTNLALSYFELNKPDKAIEILNNSLKLGNVEDNSGLFIRTYLALSDVYSKSGDYLSAYEYVKLARAMQSSNSKIRVKKQIYDMAAKYDLQAKESKIKEELHKNRIYQQQKKYLIIIAVFSVLLLLILLFLFHFKNKAYKILLRQNIKAQRVEKKLDQQIRETKIPEIIAEENSSEEEKHLQLGRKIEKFMIEEQPYLYENLSMDEVSKKLNTNRTYLSKAIQLYFKKSFSDLVCDYRIRIARDYLLDPENNHISVEGIGKMAGFKSNSVFHKNFKAHTGLTPNYFRNNLNQE